MERFGTFSSSQVYKLIKSGTGNKEFSAPGLTYIEEVGMERELNRPLSNEINAKATSWGILMELYVFTQKLGIEYKLEHKTRYAHPEMPYWTGCPDVETDEVVGDIKCPYTLKSFVQSIRSFESVEKFKADKPEYYWQLVSNATLTNKNKCQSIIFVPELSELDTIREWKSNDDVVHQNGLNTNKFAWIDFASNEDLPHLVSGGKFNSLNVFEFEPIKGDKEFLKQRIEKANGLIGV